MGRLPAARAVRGKGAATPRSGLFAAAVAVAVALGTAGCTGTAARPAPPTSAPRPASMAAPDTGTRAPGPQAPETPQMTPVDAQKCSTTTVRGSGSGPLRIDGRRRPDP